MILCLKTKVFKANLSEIRPGSLPKQLMQEIFDDYEENDRNVYILFLTSYI